MRRGCLFKEGSRDLHAILSGLPASVLVHYRTRFGNDVLLVAAPHISHLRDTLDVKQTGVKSVA